ncbi:hypothetical protein TIFTF001_029898 [Ficus carica]|uniref:Uncharacterized protein n=1 Tax=Ficus carica TaxID=3494 RepID=A0AA88DSQ5_FICCA|nr:hypothetical protein TIFTF001_029898 [Ficus carica]
MALRTFVRAVTRNATTEAFWRQWLGVGIRWWERSYQGFAPVMGRRWWNRGGRGGVGSCIEGR